MPKQLFALLLCAGVILGGCSKELPPRTVQEFVDDPILLEAAVVRCAQDRTESRYKTECLNARQAVSIIEAREERERAAVFEAQSERKREALRRTQEAAAEARRRAEEAERLRREAEYLAQFGELPPAPEEETGEKTHLSTNAPGAVIPDDTAPSNNLEASNPGSGERAASAESLPTDLDAVREELQRRSEAIPD